ncbi:MAG TPA: hypothetical protein VNS81_03595 [Nocardioides sp.]|nr:hypothetical protein [Nocardioides sp.]
MTDYDHYFEYTNATTTNLDTISKKIDEGIDYVMKVWDDTIAAKGLDSGWGWLISPGLKAAYEWAKDNLEDELQKLVDEFEDFCEDLWDKINDLTGDPFMLMEMNQAYIKAASRIRDEKTIIDDIGYVLTESWEGDAFSSYSRVVTQQLQAISAVDSGLKDAATACAEGALQIRSIWRDCIDALLGVANTILDAIKDGTDAGQWVTFDAGPAIKVVGKCLTATIGFANQLERYFDENVTVKSSMWSTLNSGLDGLDANNQWPQLNSREAGALGNKDGYDEKV